MDKTENDYITLKERLERYSQSDVVPFHMPGHKRNAQYGYLACPAMDITEIDGFDNLNGASGILRQAQERAADLFHVKECRFLVNGSTAGILAAMRAMTMPYDEVAVAVNCHKSVFNAAELSRLKINYFAPDFLDLYGIFASVSPASVEKTFAENPAIKLVVITSPTYEGIISDIRRIADICHKHGANLLVDEAHGAHLGLYGAFPASARELGADIVVNSLHKTLASLTQTAILHVCSDKIDIRKLDESLAMFQTSSPSYILLSSIDGVVDELTKGPEPLVRWREMAENLRLKLSGLKNIFVPSFYGLDEVFDFDMSKLLFFTPHMSAPSAMKAIRARGVELEMAGENYMLAMTGMGDTQEGMDKLYEAMTSLDGEHIPECGECEWRSVLPQKALEIYETGSLTCEYVDIDRAVGKISAEHVWAYPPGAPIIFKGCEISKAEADKAMWLYKAGVSVSSSHGGFPQKIYVVGK